MSDRFLSEHLRRLTESIRAQADRARSGSGHAGIKGASIEVVVRRILKDYLPQVFSVGTGQSTNVRGHFSPQLDAVLYSPAFPHLAVNEDSSIILCCESVLAAVECKTDWNARAVCDHFSRFCEVDCMRIGDYYGAPDMAASYFCITVERSLNRRPKLADDRRFVGVYNLSTFAAWRSPFGQTEFSRQAGNALELFLEDILKDCMRKGAGEIGDLTETYAVVSRYFGWEPSAEATTTADPDMGK